MGRDLDMRSFPSCHFALNEHFGRQPERLVEHHGWRVRLAVRFIEQHGSFRESHFEHAAAVVAGKHELARQRRRPLVVDLQRLRDQHNVDGGDTRSNLHDMVRQVMELLKATDRRFNDDGDGPVFDMADNVRHEEELAVHVLDQVGATQHLLDVGHDVRIHTSRALVAALGGKRRQRAPQSLHVRFDFSVPGDARHRQDVLGFAKHAHFKLDGFGEVVLDQVGELERLVRHDGVAVPAVQHLATNVDVEGLRRVQMGRAHRALGDRQLECHRLDRQVRVHVQDERDKR
ncbi:hypothetical protein H310_08093 [Aphanomyces invadans]|uniref:Uncharacterized protein n=1 Tax=Aphanomyces invadans TaxID=157072 RepID=A0A024U0J2_9STRA|nr:hypothetical protein H310_08093 [Aphanomyces invadans]ETV99386.1 hypothetical protein H310_08093 [Aphanomyces invadans]|eukprot:XP_008871942.1 hypothetical protein H310_08093 [Aphanomyces invadans]